MSSSRGNFLSFHGSFPYSDRSVRTEMTGAGRHAGLLIVKNLAFDGFCIKNKKIDTVHLEEKRNYVPKNVILLSFNFFLIEQKFCMIRFIDTILHTLYPHYFMIFYTRYVQGRQGRQSILTSSPEIPAWPNLYLFL